MKVLEYKKKYVDVISAISLENIEIKNKVYAVRDEQVKKMSSVLIGWLVVDKITIDYVSYLIVKKIK